MLLGSTLDAEEFIIHEHQLESKERTGTQRPHWSAARLKSPWATANHFGENNDFGTSEATSAPLGHEEATALPPAPPPAPREGEVPHVGLSYLSHFIAEQDKDQRIEDQLRQVWHRVKIHEQHIGEQQEEGDVEDHVPGEDHEGGGEEGHIIPQELPVPIHRLLPGQRESIITVLANTDPRRGQGVRLL